MCHSDGGDACSAFLDPDLKRHRREEEIQAAMAQGAISS